MFTTHNSFALQGYACNPRKIKFWSQSASDVLLAILDYFYQQHYCWYYNSNYYSPFTLPLPLPSQPLLVLLLLPLLLSLLLHSTTTPPTTVTTTSASPWYNVLVDWASSSNLLICHYCYYFRLSSDTKERKHCDSPIAHWPFFYCSFLFIEGCIGRDELCCYYY